MNGNYYPVGAQYDKRAPWNETETEEQTFECEVTEVLRKNVLIDTDQHTEIPDYDEDGNYCPDYDTSSVDWVKAYKYDQWTIEDLLHKFIELIDEVSPMLSLVRRAELSGYRKACEGWTTEDITADQV